MRQIPRRNITLWVSLFFLFIITGATFLTPISYYTIKPGTAMNVRPFVQVEGRSHAKGGDFLLTTISLRRGTVFDYLASKVTENIVLVPINQILTMGESGDQYDRRQQENMQVSQQSATIAAYRYAHKPITVLSEGVEVFHVNRTHSDLKQGDLIRKVDEKAIATTEELLAFLKLKRVGDFVRVELLRNKKKVIKRIGLIRLPGKESRAGLGIIPVTRVRLITKPVVKIEAQDIGGPSAGLMFSLEVLNQLLPYDLTKGYQIAGTGTISSEGKVGQIGGIEHKVLAAEREGAHVFFCPKDLESGDENEKLAKAKVKKLKSKMKLVPVASLKEAVRYLEGMKKTP